MAATLRTGRWKMGRGAGRHPVSSLVLRVWIGITLSAAGCSEAVRDDQVEPAADGESTADVALPPDSIASGWTQFSSAASLLNPACSHPVAGEALSVAVAPSPSGEAEIATSLPAGVTFLDSEEDLVSIVEEMETTYPPVQEALCIAEAFAVGTGSELEEPAQVLVTVGGAFTVAGTRETLTLYLLNRWPRCCPTVGLILADADEVKANFVFEGLFSNMKLLPGGGEAGRDAVVLTGGFGMGGQNSQSATVMHFVGTTLREVGSFGLGESTCGTGSASASSLRRVLRTTENGGFTMQEYFSPCDETWEPVGPVSPLILDTASRITEIFLIRSDPAEPGDGMPGDGI